MEQASNHTDDTTQKVRHGPLEDCSNHIVISTYDGAANFQHSPLLVRPLLRVGEDEPRGVPVIGYLDSQGRSFFFLPLTVVSLANRRMRGALVARSCRCVGQKRGKVRGFAGKCTHPGERQQKLGGKR